jgi:lipopolysaccharide/colanic/teichoic acid biosynthesis glycosyltransferase
VKRAFDVIVSLFGLIALAIPLALLALLVASTSRGPVLFRQQRIGLNSEPFEILKFRTMQDDASRRGPLVTVDGDPRITPIGRILRATKLDELPQLWNVLCGDMSFVGPRPEVPKYVSLYPPEVAEKVLSVRPGITDEASILFRDESGILAEASDPERAYIEEVLPKKLMLHQLYVEQRSFFGDLGIILRTLLRLVSSRGARELSDPSSR